MGIDVKKIREDFPLLKKKINGKEIIYFDNAATTQKPKEVIEAIKEFYENYNANIHRGIYYLSEKATEIYEESKEKVKEFINAESVKEIIHTKNASESINLVAYSYGLDNISSGDNVVISIMEHHSNLVPWQIISQLKNAELRVVKMNEEYEVDLEDLKEKIDKRTKIVCITHISNALGSINPIKDVIDIAHDKSIPVLVDGAQSVPHIETDVKKLDVDFLAFSSHKMLGPQGIGILYGKEELLKDMRPFLGGGDMIKYCTVKSCTYADPPYKFEAGTANVADAYGLSKAIEYLEKIGMKNIQEHEEKLTRILLKYMNDNPYIEVYGKKDLHNKAGIISFSVKNLHPHDISTLLDKENIYIRAGHHCAMPLMQYLNTEGTARCSFYLYNTKEEVEKFIEVIDNLIEVFSK